MPRLEAVKLKSFGAMVPWSRHKRRRLQKAKHVLLHVFSGDDPQYWERQLSTASTAVLCVDLQGGCHANLLDKHVYGFLLTIAAPGKLRTLLGGPPCPTVSALRSQGDGGPGNCGMKSTLLAYQHCRWRTWRRFKTTASSSSATCHCTLWPKR